MPLYDYDCSACGRRFEVVHGVHVEGPTVCPICGKGPIRKAITAPAVHFKGTGWAKRDRRATATPGTSQGSAAKRSSSEGGAQGRRVRRRRRRRPTATPASHGDQAGGGRHHQQGGLSRMVAATDWITLAEAADVLAAANIHFTSATIGGWARTGRLQSIKLGRPAVRAAGRGARPRRGTAAGPGGGPPARPVRRPGGLTRPSMDPRAILARILGSRMVAGGARAAGRLRPRRRRAAGPGPRLLGAVRPVADPAPRPRSRRLGSR